MKKKKTNFKKAVKGNVEKLKKDSAGFGYIDMSKLKDIEMFSIEKEGKLTMDIIPYIVKTDVHPDREGEIAEPGSLWYKFPFKTHRNVGADKETVVCPTTFGKPCPICDYRRKRQEEGAEWDEIKTYNPSKRNLYAVIPLAGSKLKEQIYIWDISHFLFQNQLNTEIEENEEYAGFPDLEEGYSLKVRFEEKVFSGNKYFETNRIDFSERESAYDESILDDVPCLEELLKVLTYKTLSDKFAHADDVEEEDEEAKAVVTRKPKKITKTVEEDEDDEIEEIEDEEEEEEEKPVKKVSKKKVPAKVVEEEEEDEIEDEEEEDEIEDEEEEEAPKPVKKAPAKKATAKAEKPTAKGGCPHGHKFGKDNDKFPECDVCDVWEECMDAE